MGKDTIKKEGLHVFSKLAYRSIILCYKDVSEDSLDLSADFDTIYDNLRSDLTFIGLVGIQDPLRDKVKEAVLTCQKAGVTVRMVTGDEMEYAKAIALQAGILKPEDIDKNDYTCMEGGQFESLVGHIVNEPGKPPRLSNKSKFEEIASKLKVMARSKGVHKHLFVTGLKDSPVNVVAVTGDGTNDAAALKASHVGFAMGITGTEMAKEAAHIILMDDNFASIVVAILWGRNIYQSIRKFLQFQLTVNVVALFIVFLSGIIIGESPLTSVQMLWVNLIMDTFAALALATEPPNNILLNDPPYTKAESILSQAMWRNIISQSLFQILVLLVLVFYGPALLGIPRKTLEEDWTYENGIHYTIIFHSFVFMQVFNEINCRKIEEFNIFANFFNNWIFIFVIILTIIVQVAIVEYGGLAVKCSPLNMHFHLICIGIGSLCLPFGWIFRCIPASAFSCLKFNEEPMTDVEIQKSSRSFLRQSSLGRSVSAGKTQAKKNNQSLTSQLSYLALSK